MTGGNRTDPDGVVPLGYATPRPATDPVGRVGGPVRRNLVPLALAAAVALVAVIGGANLGRVAHDAILDGRNDLWESRLRIGIGPADFHDPQPPAPAATVALAVRRRAELLSDAGFDAAVARLAAGAGPTAEPTPTAADLRRRVTVGAVAADATFEVVTTGHTAAQSERYLDAFADGWLRANRRGPADATAAAGWSPRERPTSPNIGPVVGAAAGLAGAAALIYSCFRKSRRSEQFR